MFSTAAARPRQQAAWRATASASRRSARRSARRGAADGGASGRAVLATRRHAGRRSADAAAACSPCVRAPRARARAHGPSAPSSRSRSLSSFQAPTDARSHGRPGMLRSDDARPRRAASRSPSGSSLAKDTSVVCAARGRLAAALGEQLARAARPACARARAPPASRRDSSSVDRGQRAGERLGAQRRRVEAARVLVQPRVQPGVGVGEVGVAAPRDRQALAQRRADVQHAGAVRAAQPLLPGARVGVAAERRHVHRRRRRRPGRRRAAPARRARASSAGAKQPLIQPTCEQATRRVRGPTASAISRERDFADAHAAQLARGAERAQQPGVLLVAGQDLIAAAELAGRRSPGRSLRSCRSSARRRRVSQPSARA